MVFLNGSILGIHRRPKRLVKEFRQLRRAGRVGEFVSIFLQQDSVYIASDGGRVCRPLIICDRGVPRVTSEHTAKVCSRPLQPLSFFALLPHTASINAAQSTPLSQRLDILWVHAVG